MSNKVGRGIVLNRIETATHFGIAATTLDDWIRRGCPVVSRGSRGKKWQLNSADVLKWREDDIRSQTAGIKMASSDELKRRKLAAETGTAELEFAKEADLVAPIEQTERMIIKAFGEIRSRMRNVLPSRIARRINGETDQTKIKAILLDEIDQALEALSDDDLISEADLELDPDETDDEGDD